MGGKRVKMGRQRSEEFKPEPRNMPALGLGSRTGGGASDVERGGGWAEPHGQSLPWHTTTSGARCPNELLHRRSRALRNLYNNSWKSLERCYFHFTVSRSTIGQVLKFMYPPFFQIFQVQMPFPFHCEVGGRGATGRCRQEGLCHW